MFIKVSKRVSGLRSAGGHWTNGEVQGTFRYDPADSEGQFVVLRGCEYDWYIEPTRLKHYMQCGVVVLCGELAAV